VGAGGGRKRQEGRATDEEHSTLENLERIVLLYELMMAEAVERAGPVEAEAGADPLAGLVERVARISGQDRGRLASALTAAAAKGDLACVREGRSVRFRWREFLAPAGGAGG